MNEQDKVVTLGILHMYFDLSETMREHCEKLVKIIEDNEEDIDDRKQAWYMLEEILSPELEKRKRNEV